MRFRSGDLKLLTFLEMIVGNQWQYFISDNWTVFLDLLSSINPQNRILPTFVEWTWLILWALDLARPGFLVIYKMADVSSAEINISIAYMMHAIGNIRVVILLAASARCALEFIIQEYYVYPESVNISNVCYTSGSMLCELTLHTDSRASSCIWTHMHTLSFLSFSRSSSMPDVHTCQCPSVREPNG